MTWILHLLFCDGGVSPLLLTMILTLSFFSAETESASFEIVNNCNYTIWPGLMSTGTNKANLSTTGFILKSGASFNLSVPESWTGRVWGRTLCNESSGNFSCFTADCGTGKIECEGNSAKLPATLAEFSLNSFNNMDYYDVSLVDGFNLPMVVEPRRAGTSNCSSSGCPADLNGACPKELRVARGGSQETVACNTACATFNNALFCCTGEYSSPDKCAGTVYSEYFKQRCPQAYTYAYDDSNQTMYTCASANYSIVFCPISLDEKPAEIPTASEIPSNSKTKKSKNNKIIVASVASTAGIVILISMVLAGLWRSRRKRQQGIQMDLEDGRCFRYSELVKITNNFASPIGAGGFGKVYHGILDNDIQVAVKLLNTVSGSNEFQNEVKLLMRAHHKNVVSFVGYCNERQTMALVFEYVANGNLQQHLTLSDAASGNILTWKERLQIAVDAAKGLDYLHNGCKPPIIHRDIKTSNILLTEKMQAKICDFGVSKLLSTETATHTMTDHVRGTRGYFDPEYYTTGILNKKSDIYSFGIVLLELITGRTAITTTDVEPEPIHICQWVKPMFERTELEKILDPMIQAGTYNVSSAWKAIEIAMECVSSTAIERPHINVVYKKLKECLEIEAPPEIAKFAELDQNDDSSNSSSVSVQFTSHTESDSFSVHMKSQIEPKNERHTN